MKTKNIVLLLAVILSFNIVSGIVVGQTETGTVPPGVTPSGKPVPSEIIAKSDSYIKNLVGDEYFSKHLKLIANVTIQSGNEISYILTYSYDMNLPEGYLINPSLPVSVTLSKDESVTQYLGPKKAHTFAMQKEKVIEIAKNNGLTEPIDAGIDRVLTLATGSMDGYVWVVTGAIDESTCKVVGAQKECSIPGVYIDVDNGAVISKFNSSSLIQSPSTVTTTVPTETQPTETPTETPVETQTPKSPFIGGAITIIALLIVAFVVRHKYKTK